MRHRTPLGEAFQLSVVSLASFLCGFHFTSLFHPQSAAMGGLWALISGIVVLQADWPATWSSAKLRIVGSLIGAIVSALYLYFLPFNPFGMAACILVTVLLCHAMGIPEPARLAALTVALIMVISNLNPAVSPLISAALRFGESFLGAAMAVLAVRFWPKGAPDAVPVDSADKR